MSGDPLKKVQPGDPLEIPAETFNTFIDVAQDWKARTSRFRQDVRQPSRERTVVLVKNNTEADWPVWRPVAVGKPKDYAVASHAVSFAERPFFPGYDLDGVQWTMGQPTLGITQEPIAAGRCGRVCIRGPTVALMQKCPDGWINNSDYNWVHVFKTTDDEENDRWVLRNGPGGDACLLQILDSDVYEDGTHNDQYLVLIDLCDVPNRIAFRNASGQTMPAHSIARESGGMYDQGATYNPWLSDVRLVATCGWPLTNYQYGWAYQFREDVPVKVTFSLSYPPTSTGHVTFGPVPEDFEVWPHLTGLDRYKMDWYKIGEEPYRVWVRKNIRPFWVKADGCISEGGYAWPCSKDGDYVFDGGTYYGIAYPLIRSEVVYPPYPDSRYPNVQDGQIFLVTFAHHTGHSFLADAAVLDDAIGMVKIWPSASIPGGWRVDEALQARFPVGYKSGDPDFGSLYGTGGNKTHTHGAGSAFGASGTDLDTADHLPPFSTVIFIERYQ